MASADRATPSSKPATPLQRNTSRLGRSLSYISSALAPGPSRRMSSALKRTHSKLTPFERFMQLGRRNTDGTVTFPPPHWTQQGDGGPSTTITPTAEGNINTDVSVRSGSPETILIDREDLAPTPTSEPGSTAAPGSSESEAAEPDGHADSEPAPEPSYLARKIQTLLATLPIPSQPQTPATEAASEPDSVHPPKLPLPSWIADSRLVSYLTSPQVMNGSAAKGRPSVWDMLDRLKSTTGVSKSPSPPIPPADEKGKAPARPAEGTASAPHARQRADDDDDSASMMLYAPLVPDDSSEVEIARSEVISMFSDQTTIHEHEPETKEEVTLRERLSSMWPSGGLGIGGHKLPAEQPRERRIWVPSKDKISFEILWWGYRIYLPPPVLGVLDNKRIENTKRAALLTTALKWLLDHIPMAAIPMQVRPVMPLLRRIIPYTGYLGVFVAWSWDAIRAFDKGNGVILTATWLLTFALVPGTWEDNMFPEVASSAPSSTSGPPASDVSSPTNQKS